MEDKKNIVPNLIQEILKSRAITKGKIDKTYRKEQVEKEEIQKFHAPVVTVLEKTTTPPVINSTPVLNSIPLTPIMDRQPYTHDIDRGLDRELLDKHELMLPSRILEDSDRITILEDLIKKVGRLLKSFGGKKGRTRKGSELHKIYQDEVEDLQKYLNTYKIVHQALLVQTGSGLYKNNDELIARLMLLTSSKQAGNNSTEDHNEIVDILDTLLRNEVISEEKHKMIYNKWY